MKRVWAVILAAALALSLTACGKEESGTGGKLPSGSKSADQTDTVETPELASLRESITGSGADIGVAYLGYAGEIDSMKDAVELLQNGAYAESYPFLLTLPDDAFVNVEGEELYAFVPADSGDTLTIYAADITDSGDYRKTGKPLCEGKPGEVLLARCNVSDLHANVCVETDGKQFYPMLSLMDGSVYMEGDYFDFTLYEALWDFGGSSGENSEWLLSDDETNIRIATELLCEAEEVRDYIALGMSVQYTGEHVMVDGHECWVFALGTEREAQFVREIFYAVCDNLIYRYDPIEDNWAALTGEAAFGSVFTLADMEGTWQAVSSLDVSYPDQEPTPLNGTPVTLVLESHWDAASDTTTLTGEYRENWGKGERTESGLTAEVRSGGMNGICPNQAWFVELCHRDTIWISAALTDWDTLELQVYHPDTAASVIYTCEKAGGGAG